MLWEWKVAARFVMLIVFVGMSCVPHAEVLDLLKAGLAARNRGDLDVAIKFYTQAIDSGRLSDEKLALVLGSRGVSFDMKGELDKAIDDFNEAIRLKPDYSRAYIYRGLTLVKKNDGRRAIIDFTEAITLDPHIAYVALNDRANAYELIGDDDRAIEDYGRAIQLNPGYTETYFNRAMLLYKKGDYDGAIDDDSRAIDLNPDYVFAYRNRGVAYLAKDKNEMAIADFSAAIALDPYDATAYGNRGTANAAMGEFERSVFDLSAAITLNPDRTEFYIKRAQAMLYSDRPDAAIADLIAALKLDPTEAYAMVWLHLAYVRAGRNDSSELRSAARNVEPSKWLRVVVDLFLGNATPEMVDIARDANDALGEYSERQCQTSFYLGMFNLEKGNKVEAEQYFRASVDFCPRSLFEFAAAKVELVHLNSPY